METEPNRKKLAQRQLLLLDYMSGKDIRGTLSQYQSSRRQRCFVAR